MTITSLRDGDIVTLAKGEARLERLPVEIAHGNPMLRLHTTARIYLEDLFTDGWVLAQYEQPVTPRQQAIAALAERLVDSLNALPPEIQTDMALREREILAIPPRLLDTMRDEVLWRPMPTFEQVYAALGTPQLNSEGEPDYNAMTHEVLALIEASGQ